MVFIDLWCDRKSMYNFEICLIIPYLPPFLNKQNQLINRYVISMSRAFKQKIGLG